MKHIHMFHRLNRDPDPFDNHCQDLKNPDMMVQILQNGMDETRLHVQSWQKRTSTTYSSNSRKQVVLQSIDSWWLNTYGCHN